MHEYPQQQVSSFLASSALNGFIHAGNFQNNPDETKGSLNSSSNLGPTKVAVGGSHRKIWGFP